jgi:hypothetical protein
MKILMRFSRIIIFSIKNFIFLKQNLLQPTKNILEYWHFSVLPTMFHSKFKNNSYPLSSITKL